MSKITMKSTKQEIMEAYEEAMKKIAETEAGKDDPVAAAKVENDKKIIESADTVAEGSILNPAIISQYNDLKTAIQMKKEELNNLYGIEVEANSLVAIINAHKDKDTELKDSFKEFVGVEDNVKALMDLGVGGSDAVAMDTVVARYYMAKDPGKYSIIKDTTILDEKMGVGFRKGDNALCKKVEDTLKEMKKDGTLAKISKEWFGEDLTIIGEDK